MFINLLRGIAAKLAQALIIIVCVLGNAAIVGPLLSTIGDWAQGLLCIEILLVGWGASALAKKVANLIDPPISSTKNRPYRHSSYTSLQEAAQQQAPKSLPAYTKVTFSKFKERLNTKFNGVYKIILVLDVVSALLLALCMFDWSYEFYEFTRPCLMLLLGWSAFIEFVTFTHSPSTSHFCSSITKAVLSFIFMPKDIPLYLEKELWLVIDLVSIIILVFFSIKNLKGEE